MEELKVFEYFKKNDCVSLNCSPDDINKHFVQNFSSPVQTYFSDNNGSCSTSFRFSEVQDFHIVNAINDVKSNAVGLDDIPIKFIKMIFPLLLKPLKHIFNSIFKSGIYPKVWKYSKIIPIKKKPMDNTLENLRPISILSAISKVFERLVKNQITCYLSENCLLSQFQSGYRKGHSIKTAMIKVCDDIGVVLDKGGSVILLLLDFSKAFDTISHIKLCKKLENNFGFSYDAVQLIRSYLSDRSQTVFVNDCFSEYRPILSGVPQGSVLGPLLFSIYINDLPLKLNGCQIHLFADDVQIYVDVSGMTKDVAANLINNNLSNISLWASENSLKLNARKTQACYITRSNRNYEKPDLNLNGIPIVYSETVVSLGVTIQSNFEWDGFVLKQCGKIYSVLRTLRYTADFLQQDTKLKLFKSLIYPHLLFCDFVTTQASAYIMNKLRVALNCCVRFVYNLDRYSPVSHLHKSLIGCTFNNFPVVRSVFILHSVIFKNCPQYLYSKLIRLRSPRGIKFSMPRATTSHYANSLLVRSICNWNSLPVELQNIVSPLHFKKAFLQQVS